MNFNLRQFNQFTNYYETKMFAGQSLTNLIVNEKLMMDRIQKFLRRPKIRKWKHLRPPGLST